MLCIFPITYSHPIRSSLRWAMTIQKSWSRSRTVLQAVLDISQGQSTEAVIDALCSQLEPLNKDLGNDNEALQWFNLSSPAFSTPLTSPASDLRPNRLAGEYIETNFNPLFHDFPSHRRLVFSSSILLSSSLWFSSLPPDIIFRPDFGGFFTISIPETQKSS